MRIEVVYCFPQIPGDNWTSYAYRFLETYLKFPALAQHETVVMLNGGPGSDDVCGLFKVLPGCRFLQHDNSGYDLGSYQAAARESKADLQVYFSASTYFRREGWLNRMATVFHRRGPGIYGAMGNRGHPPLHAYNRVYPHLRTTAFWMAPALFRAYPIKIETAGRYEAEHGASCITGWVIKQGLKAILVTFDGEYEWEHWDADPNGFHQGNQSSLLVGDRLSEPPYYHCS